MVQVRRSLLKIEEVIAVTDFGRQVVCSGDRSSEASEASDGEDGGGGGMEKEDDDMERGFRPVTPLFFLP